MTKGEYKFSKRARYINLDKEVVLDKNGVRITEAIAQQLAEDYLASVGRPSLTGLPANSPEIKARVPHDIKTALRKRAKSENKTVSQVIREAIESYLRSA